MQFQFEWNQGLTFKLFGSNEYFLVKMHESNEGQFKWVNLDGPGWTCPRPNETDPNFLSMHIMPLIRIQTTAKMDSIGITSDCVCPETDETPSSGTRGRIRRSIKIEDKDKIKETARIIVDPENDKIPDSVVRMRTEQIEVTPLARSRSPAVRVSQSF